MSKLGKYIEPWRERLAPSLFKLFVGDNWEAQKYAAAALTLLFPLISSELRQEFLSQFLHHLITLARDVRQEEVNPIPFLTQPRKHLLD